MKIVSADASVDIRLKIDKEKSIAGFVAATGRTLNIRDAYLDKRFDPSWDRKTGYKTKAMLVMAVFPESQERIKRPAAVVQVSSPSSPIGHGQGNKNHSL